MSDATPESTPSTPGPVTDSSTKPIDDTAEAPDEVAEAEIALTEVELALIDRDEWMDRAQRIAADFENFRRRHATQRADDIDRATGRLAEALLPVLDACEAAFLQHPAEIEPLFNLMLSELKKQGLESMNLHEQPFDPHLADAVLHEPGDGEPVVSEVLRSGYTWNGKVLRPAMVKVRGQGSAMAAQREWYEKDYYKVLGVGEDAAPKDITKAYRKLARSSHPDTHPGDDAAEERFKEISAAYDVLGDEAKRKEYDEVRKLGPIGGFQAGPPGGGPGGYNFNVGSDGLGDILGHMFGRGRRGGGPSAAAGPQRGADVEATLSLAFADAVQGLTTTLYLTSDAECSTCHGSGAKPGTQPKVCSNCGGRGVIDDNQGLFSFSTPCRVCGGRGVVVTDACPTCHGTGTERRAREVQARIPAGVADGQKIRLKGRGAPGRNGGPPGDLIVECHVAGHRLFGRDGNNLTVKVPVTYAEAALGGDVDVPTLDGPRVMLRLRPGTPSGSRHRVKGKGIVTKKATGDLIVTVDVDVPNELSDEQRAAVEALAAATTVSPRTRLES